MSAQSIVTNYSGDATPSTARPVRKFSVSLVTATGGTVNGTIPNRAGTSPLDFIGFLQRVVIDPGSPAPTDDYDLTIKDSQGVDLLRGLGANRDTTTTEELIPGARRTDGTNFDGPRPSAVAGPLVLDITNAGDAKALDVHLYFSDNP